MKYIQFIQTLLLFEKEDNHQKVHQFFYGFITILLTLPILYLIMVITDSTGHFTITSLLIIFPFFILSCWGVYKTFTQDVLISKKIEQTFIPLINLPDVYSVTVLGFAAQAYILIFYLLLYIIPFLNYYQLINMNSLIWYHLFPSFFSAIIALIYLWLFAFFVCLYKNIILIGLPKLLLKGPNYFQSCFLKLWQYFGKHYNFIRLICFIIPIFVTAVIIIKHQKQFNVPLSRIQYLFIHLSIFIIFYSNRSRGNT